MEKKEERKHKQIRARRYETVGRGFCRQPSDISDGILRVSVPASRDRGFRARALFTPRFRENERRKRGEDGKKRGGKETERRATRLLLCKLRRRVKVCLQSARARLPDRALEMDKDLEDRSRSPTALVRNLSADRGPAFSHIVSRRESRQTRNSENESRSALRLLQEFGYRLIPCHTMHWKLRIANL